LIWARSLAGWMSDLFELKQMAIQDQLSALGGIEVYKVGKWRDDSD
jgi:hypothetical protein